MLDIRELSVKVNEKVVLKNFSLSLPNGEVHVLMGRNGVGKSTLANVIVGHPDFEIISGDILLDGQSIVTLPVDARARMGLFLSFQTPIELPGVSVANFIREALQSRLNKRIDAVAFYKKLYSYMDLLKLDRSITSRSMNVGFSGGERKRLEILQMLILEPKCVILDEIDSGVDADALKLIANGFNELRDENFCALIITHYKRLFDYIKPDVVHVMDDGAIIKSGNCDLVNQIETMGYEQLENQ